MRAVVLILSLGSEGFPILDDRYNCSSLGYIKSKISESVISLKQSGTGIGTEILQQTNKQTNKQTTSNCISYSRGIGFSLKAFWRVIS